MHRTRHVVGIAVVGALALALAGCNGSSSGSGSGNVVSSNAGANGIAPAINIGFPSTLNGGGGSSGSSISPQSLQPEASGGPNCTYLGGNAGDPFRNGFIMTQWLVANVQGWTCLADFIVQTATTAVQQGLIPSDGSFIAATNPNPGDPTGFRVLKDATGKWTVQLYWSNRTTVPGLFISWNGADPAFAGKVIADVANWQGTNVNVPAFLRMDFTYNGTARTVDMYLAWPGAGTGSGNAWINGFRVHAVETLRDGSFIVQGFMDLKAQFDTGFAYTGYTPSFVLKTVSDHAGNGGSIAHLNNLGIPLVVRTNPTIDTLGHFVFSKADTYYFSSSGLAQYINKAISFAHSFGDASGTTIPTTTLESQVDVSLSLAAGTTNACETGSNVACQTVFTALFTNGLFGQDRNSGSLPSDGRPAALAALVDLTTAIPSDSPDWAHAFAESF